MQKAYKESDQKYFWNFVQDKRGYLKPCFIIQSLILLIVPVKY